MQREASVVREEPALRGLIPSIHRHDRNLEPRSRVTIHLQGVDLQTINAKTASVLLPSTTVTFTKTICWEARR